MASREYKGLDEPALKTLAGNLASLLQPGMVIYLQGNLGTGKTTFTQAVLQTLGISGPVKSPTYTLVEPYTVATGPFYHFDLYRLGLPEELEFLGIRDYFHEDSLCFVEWPEKGAGFLPDADLEISLRAEKDLTRS